MDKGNIRIIKAIVHILDSVSGFPVLSDVELEVGPDFSEFLKEHIYKVATGDDSKNCTFLEGESEFFEIIKDVDENNFIEVSKQAAGMLFSIMNSNIDIPAADLVVVVYSYEESFYLALLKMNYKNSYTHITKPASDDGLSANDIVMHKAILPTKTQRVSEAALINLDDMSIRIVEKKYDVNGHKENYFSKMYIGCRTSLSQKSKLDIVTKAVERVVKDNYDESQQFEVDMRARNIIHNEYINEGEIDVPVVVEKIFDTRPELKEEFNEKVEKYNISKEPIRPENEKTVKKYDRQFLKTDTGIEIKIPMHEYENKDSVEFITNPDGTVSVLIKNVEKIYSK